MWGLAEINRVSDTPDVTDGNDAATGGKPIRSRSRSPPCNAATLFFYLGPSRAIDASLSAYLRSAVYGSDGPFDLYKLPLFSVC